MKKKILIFSTSRADYGILENIIKDLSRKSKIIFYLGFTGSHFSKKYGHTISEINKKIRPKKIFKIKNLILSKDDGATILKNILKVFSSISQILKKNKFDQLIVLGDRYELIGICLPFFFKKIPIAHIHGGEETTGSYDNEIRKIISIISNLHFVSHINYKKNLVKMLKNKKNIHHVGSLAAEKIKKIKFFYSKKILEKKFNIKFSKKNIVVSLHPETNNLKNHKKNINIFFKTIKKYKKTNFFFTSPGHDMGSGYILKKINSFLKKQSNSYFVKSFSNEYYFSILKNSDGLIGNSSSGIIECPSLKVPVINLGKRQSGRILSKNILNSNYEEDSLDKNINKIFSKNIRTKINRVKNVYYKKNTKKNIVNLLIKNLNKNNEN